MSGFSQTTYRSPLKRTSDVMPRLFAKGADSCSAPDRHFDRRISPRLGRSA